MLLVAGCNKEKLMKNYAKNCLRKQEKNTRAEIVFVDSDADFPVEGHGIICRIFNATKYVVV